MKSELKKNLANYLKTNASRISLASKGRVGLYGLLKAFQIQPGDEIIIPAFTCVVVPNAIIYLGAIPIFAEIDPFTYNIDTSKLESRITDKTKIIIAQNTYGLSSELDQINVIAKNHNIAVIEDCTHGFGGKYNGILNGKHVKAAFYSTQWNKMFSTGFGGIVLSNDDKIASFMNQFEEKLIAPSFFEQSMLQVQIWLKDLLGYSFLYWSALKFYRALSSKNIIKGSSSGGELTDTNMPSDYLKSFTGIQAKRALKELNRIQSNIEHRRSCAKSYDKALLDIGIAPPVAPEHIFHTYTKYPILVKNRKEIFEKAEKANIPIHDWFISPIHPVQKNYEKWFFKETQFPIATLISKHIINLPTDLSVSGKMKNRVVQFIHNHKNDFVNYEILASGV